MSRLLSPAVVTPMLTTPGEPPRGLLAQWAVEMKWDGVRALALISGGQLRLTSRSGRDITASYPELSGMAAAVPREQALLDGEIVVFVDGRPDFEALQPRVHTASATVALRLADVAPVTYLAFDVLQLDGAWLTALPYTERRAILADIIPNGPGWLCPPSFPGPDLDAVRAASIAEGHEGVVAKRLDSPYEPGVRSRNWLKLKNRLGQEVVVAGWKPGAGNRAGLIGSLLVGVHATERGGRAAASLLYCGHVGTGFSAAALRLLTVRLAALRRPRCPFDGPVPPEHARAAVWADPRLVVEVAFTGWTRAGRMRAPVYRGLRDDKDPAGVVRET